MDGVTAYAILSVLCGRHLAEDTHRALARSIGRLRDLRLPDSGDRGYIDDRPTARLPHGRNSVLGAEEYALGIDSHDAIPIFHRAIFDGGDLGNDRGVVD